MFFRMRGKNIPDGVKFCPYCGNTTVRGKKRGNGGFLVTIVVLSVLLCAAVVAIILMKPWEKKSSYTAKDEISSTEPQVGTSDNEKYIIQDESANIMFENPGEAFETAGESFDVITDGSADEESSESVENVEEAVNPIAAYFLERCENTEKWATALWEIAVTQHEINAASAEIYAKWDKILNEVYEYLKDTMPPEEFELLKADEIEWIKEKDAAVEAEGKNWEGGSGAPMAMNGVASAYTKERCYYLISLIK